VSIKKVTAILQSRLATIDWKLLIFLLLFLNVKLVVKVVAVILIYALRRNFKFGFKIKNTRLPLFYLIIIGIGLFNWMCSGLLANTSYTVAIVTGIFFWLLCILAIHQVKLSVEKNDPTIIHHTILLFFIINIIASLAVYGSIICETGSINPYRYQGNFQKYFIGTGDYIKGITLDTSTTNAVINAFGVIYFLLRNKNLWALLCMVILVLTGSNITNLLIGITLLYIFVFQSTKTQKSIIVICLLCIAVFLSKISPQNNNYITTSYEKIVNPKYKENITSGKIIPVKDRPDSILNEEEKKQKIAYLYLDSVHAALKAKLNTAALSRPLVAKGIYLKEKPIIPKDNIHSAPFQHKYDTTVFQANLLTFIKEDKVEEPAIAIKKNNLPGKLIALIQTADYFQLHPFKIITGCGMGMFSSKLAFRITALKIAGGYPAKFAFINNDFKNNNLAVYLDYFTKNAGFHSLINTPNSTYNQLVSEYGIVGLAAFLFFYLGFFFRHLKKISYGLPILLIMSGFFFTEYWFEQLSVVVLFELLLLLNIKENEKAVSQ